MPNLKLFQQQNAPPILAQLPRRGAPRHASANHDYIEFFGHTLAGWISVFACREKACLGKNACVKMARSLIVASIAILLCGCASVRKPVGPTAAHFRIVTYNVNRGSNPADIAESIRVNGADIVCLQEADFYEDHLRPRLSTIYPKMAFRDSDTRVGGGYVFLSKYPAREIAWIPSDTGWFGGWIMA